MDSGAEFLEASPGDHIVLFYRSDEELTERLGGYLLSAIRDDGTAVVLATPAHQLSVEGWLADAGVDVAAARAGGSYLALDASATMRRFVVAGRPDPAGFWQAITPVIRRAVSSGRPVHVFGEMVWLLWDSGLVNAAIEVEAMWNELSRQYPFALLCAYPAQSVSDPDRRDAVAEVCGLHTAAAGVPAEPDPPGQG